MLYSMVGSFVYLSEVSNVASYLAIFYFSAGICLDVINGLSHI